MNKDGPKFEIFSQGDEVVTGQTADTNAAWLSRQLVELGFDVMRHTAVGDRLDALVDLLLEIARRADGCICTGGLGPTRDDLTAEAVSRAFAMPLREDTKALADIEQRYASLGRVMPAVNRKQALIPDGAVRLDNAWGTAPGFSLHKERCWFAFLPGVPYEMRNVFRERVKPELVRRFRAAPWKLVTLRTVGLGESAIEERLERFTLPEEVELSFRSGPHDVQTKLLFPQDYPEPALRQTVLQAAGALGTAVYGIDGLEGEGGDLPTVIGRLLAEAGSTLALAETVSGGLAASQCLARFQLLESVVVGDGDRLLRRYGVHRPPEGDNNAWDEAAKALARRVRETAGADYGLIQIGNDEKPKAGEVEGRLRLRQVLAAPDDVVLESCLIAGDGIRRQNLAACAMLDLLRRHLSPRII